MLKSRKPARLLYSLLASFLCVVLVAAACGEEDDTVTPAAQPTEAPPPSPTGDGDEGTMEGDDEEPAGERTHLGDGSLGCRGRRVGRRHPDPLAERHFR